MSHLPGTLFCASSGESYSVGVQRFRADPYCTVDIHCRLFFLLNCVHFDFIDPRGSTHIPHGHMPTPGVARATHRPSSEPNPRARARPTSLDLFRASTIAVTCTVPISSRRGWKCTSFTHGNQLTLRREQASPWARRCPGQAGSSSTRGSAAAATDNDDDVPDDSEAEARWNASVMIHESRHL